MEMDEYQRFAQATDQVPARHGDGLVVPLLGLVGEVGTLATDYKKRLRDGDSYRFYADDLTEELGDVLWYVANVAHKSGLKLSDIAAANLEKNRDRWVKPDAERTAYDQGFPASEQLPSSLLIDFAQSSDETGTYVRVLMEDGTQVGDPLTDNSRLEDGFRFHDALHLANLAVLGWSPVVRGFLGRKRRSNPHFDEVEDGGRAKVTEEAIVAFVFSRARQLSFFAGSTRVDNDVLDTIANLVGHFEVRDRTRAEWEKTILAGYEVWRALRDNGGGLVRVDLDARTISYMGR